MPNLVPEKEIRFDATEYDSGKSEDEDEDENEVEFIDIEDAPPAEAAALRRKISNFLPDERAVRWERKKVTRSLLHEPPL